jgi:hypothetical protein
MSRFSFSVVSPAAIRSTSTSCSATPYWKNVASSEA